MDELDNMVLSRRQKIVVFEAHVTRKPTATCSVGKLDDTSQEIDNLHPKGTTMSVWIGEMATIEIRSIH